MARPRRRTRELAKKKQNALFCCSNALSTLICVTRMFIQLNFPYQLRVFNYTHIHPQLIIQPNTNRSLSISILYISFAHSNLLRRINTNHLLNILYNILMYNSRSLLFFCCCSEIFSFSSLAESLTLALILIRSRCVCTVYFEIIQEEKYQNS